MSRSEESRGGWKPVETSFGRARGLANLPPLNRLRASCSYAFIFLTGATALVYEVIWQRYLTRLTGNDSLATALILGIFLGGLSGGYALCGWLSRRFDQPLRIYAGLEAIMGLWGLIFPALFAAVASATSAWSFAPPG